MAEQNQMKPPDLTSLTMSPQPPPPKGDDGEEEVSTEIHQDAFDKISKNKYFVDRTLFLEKFISGKRRVFLTAPRRFGKSIIKDMIHKFVEPDVDKKGVINTDMKSHKNYRIFEKKLYGGVKQLQIFEKKDFFERHFGKYPVVHLDLKGICVSDKKTFKYCCADRVAHLYREHSYLRENLGELERTKFDSRLFYKSGSNVPTSTQLSMAVKDLQILLEQHFKQKCIVLVDELDAPVRQMLLDHFLSDTDMENMISFYKSFVRDSFNGNSPHIYAMLITCTMHFAGIISPDHLDLITFNDKNELAEFYGVTEAQMWQLAGSPRERTQEIKEIEHWYDGYMRLETNSTFFNVFPVVKYFYKQKFAPYWVETGGVSPFKWMFSFENVGKKLLSLIDPNNSLVLPIREKYMQQDLFQLKKMLFACSCNSVSEEEANLFLRYMTEDGYFTTVQKSQNLWTIKIPNNEIRYYIQSLVFYGTKFDSTISTSEEFRNTFFKTILYLNCEISFKYLLTMLAWLVGSATTPAFEAAIYSHIVCAHMYFPPETSELPKFKVRFVQNEVLVSSKESYVYDWKEKKVKKQKGRADCIFVIELAGDIVAYIFEFNEGLNESSETAANQAVEKQYIEALNSSKMKKVGVDDLTTKVIVRFHYESEVCGLSYVYDAATRSEKATLPKVHVADALAEMGSSR